MRGRLRELAQRVLSLFRGRRLDEDLAEELAAHLDMAVADDVRAGMSPQEARRRALVRLGGLERTRVLHREARGLPLLETLAQDARHALRALRGSPAFATVAVGVLALGIGGNASIFSLVSAVLLRPLPLRDPDGLVVLWAELSVAGAPGGPIRVEPAPGDYTEWKARSRSFAGLAALERRVYNLTGAGEPEKLVGLRVTGNLFELLGLRMALGAQRADVVGSVVGRALLLAAAGIALGVAGVLALWRALASVLFGVGPADPVTFVAVPAAVLAVALLAAYVPARRAASIDPVLALRAE